VLPFTDFGSCSSHKIIHNWTRPNASNDGQHQKCVWAYLQTALGWENGQLGEKNMQAGGIFVPPASNKDPFAYLKYYKDSTRTTLSLVIHRVRFFFKNLQKSTFSNQLGLKLTKIINFGGKLSFILSFFFHEYIDNQLGLKLTKIINFGGKIEFHLIFLFS